MNKLIKFKSLVSAFLLVCFASVVNAAPTLTVPALDTASGFSAGDAVMVGLAAILGITIAIRVFKKI